MGEAHRGTPVTVPAVGRSPDDLTTTASLYQAHAPWTTAVLVELDISGHDERWRPATIAATVTVEQAGDLARVLAGLAADGAARQVADDAPAGREREVGR